MEAAATGIGSPADTSLYLALYTRAFFFLFPVTFFNSPVAGVYKMYTREENVAEVSKVFAALSPDPWHKGRRRVDEENNPATVRWIDMMRTYVDM